MKEKCFVLVILFGFLGLAFGNAVTLTQVDARVLDDSLQIILEGSGPLVYTSYHRDANHFVIELPETDWAGGSMSLPIQDGKGKVKIERTPYSLQVVLPVQQTAEPSIQSLGSKAKISFTFPYKETASLNDIQVDVQGSSIVLNLLGEGLPEPSIEYMDHPTRIVLDFSNTLFPEHQKTLFINRQEVEQVRIAQFAMEPVPITRVVMEAKDAYPIRLDTMTPSQYSAVVDLTSSRPMEEGAPLADPQEAIASEQFEPKSIGQEEVAYTGEPIELHLKDAPIEDVLASFSQYLNLNIVVDPDVTGSVTVNLVDVPWDQALDLILKVNGLSYVIENNVMRVAKASKLAAEAQQRRNLEKEQELSQPLQTVIRRLSYARANQIQNTIKQIMSERGNIFVDERTNTLIIREIPKYLPPVLDLVKSLDIATPQVTIESRIVETTKNFIYRLGIDWGFHALADTRHGNTTGLRFPNTYDITGDITLPSGNYLLDMTFGNILGTFNLDMALTAAETDGLAKIISSPRVTTQDNLSAMIQSGVQIPVQTTANNTTTVQYIDATLQLQVTPQITAEGTVIMKINVQKREPLTGLGIVGGQNVPLSTRQAQTQVMVKDGGSTVIGGIYQLTDNMSKDRIPFLHRIPIIGNLFKNYGRESRHDELLIFISPRIVKNI